MSVLRFAGSASFVVAIHGILGSRLWRGAGGPRCTDLRLWRATLSAPSLCLSTAPGKHTISCIPRQHDALEASVTPGVGIA